MLTKCEGNWVWGSTLRSIYIRLEVNKLATKNWFAFNFYLKLREFL